MKLCKEMWLLTRITLLVNNKSINMFCWKFSGFVFSTFLKNTDTFTFLHVTSCSQHLFVTWFSYHEEEDDGEVAGGGCQTTDHSLRRLKVLSNRRSCVCANQNRHFRDKTWYFPYLNQVFFVPKPNWNISTALTQDTIENWTLRNVKLHHKECEVLIFILAIGLHQGNNKRKKNTISD